ncbi:MAG: ORF6N domain-containing protein [Alphaproteobacteria bacterium]|nr:ORF6N domain-containing protein [Alphaproteobacteria bacterium]
MNEELKISTTFIENRIFSIRNIQVMLDRDLAEMYQVPVKRLNEQVKRNIDRFPASFRFQLTSEEKNELVANCDRFENIKHSSTQPFAFTEQGVAMLSAVLRSDIAVQVSIQIMNAFVQMRKSIISNAGIFQRLDKIEHQQIESNQKFEQLFKALEEKDTKPTQGVFFDNQVFDAYTLMADIVRTAKNSIVLIDNYIDDTVLTHLCKKETNVKVTLLTKTISKQLQLDVKKANTQYPKIEVKTFTKAHDRFLIIDKKEVYHLGASLKDLGKKWFAFSKMDKDSVTIINSILDLI